MERLSDREEEILESLWVEINERKTQPNIRILKDEPSLENLKAEKLIDLEAPSLLTEKGMKEAAGCVRRHRLAERLLADILYIRDPLIHEASCKFEHGLHHGLEDNVCTLLGHPKACPHGRKIPPGACCESFEKIPQRLIVSLQELAPQDRGKVSYINTEDKAALRKLISMGVLPGNEIKLLHRFPSFVFEMGKSSFAIDKDLAENIYVLLLKGNKQKPAGQ